MIATNLHYVYVILYLAVKNPASNPAQQFVHISTES